MTNNKLTDPASFLNFIKPYVSSSGLISFNGVARCINLKPYEFMDNSGCFKERHLAYRMQNLNYKPKVLHQYGFGFEAFLIVLDYYAFSDNGSAFTLLSTIKLFDCELEILKLVAKEPIDIEKHREVCKFETPVYLSYIDLIKAEKSGFLHNVAGHLESPCFKRKDGKKNYIRTNHLATETSLVAALDAHLLRPANISLDGIAEIIQVRPQVIASKRQSEIISKYLRRKLIYFGFSTSVMIHEGFPFVAFLLVLEHFDGAGNKAATVALSTLERFDCELKIFRKLHRNGRGETKFLRDRYFTDYPKTCNRLNETLAEPYRTSIVYKYQKQLEQYRYHNDNPEAPLY